MMSVDINPVLDERASRYGSYSENSKRYYDMLDTLKANFKENGNEFDNIPSEFKLAIEMILQKLIRMSKDYQYCDNWVDIIGYANLALRHANNKKYHSLVTLLHNSPIALAILAMNISRGNSYDIPIVDFINNSQKQRLDRVVNKLKHKSILEQLSYTFLIKGTSRAVLQELARHRTAKLTVKSTRYTLGRLKKMTEVELRAAIYHEENVEVRDASIEILHKLTDLLQKYPIDCVKSLLPESFTTDLIWTIDGRNLQNFLELRTNEDAYKPIRTLAQNIYYNLPKEHKFLYSCCIKDKDEAIPESE